MSRFSLNFSYFFTGVSVNPFGSTAQFLAFFLPLLHVPVVLWLLTDSDSARNARLVVYFPDDIHQLRLLLGSAEVLLQHADGHVSSFYNLATTNHIFHLLNPCRWIRDNQSAPGELALLAPEGRDLAVCYSTTLVLILDRGELQAVEDAAAA
jgi:ABC-type uncharacterized transport system permease subunit